MRDISHANMGTGSVAMFQPASRQEGKMIVSLVGPPGAGKGTQAKALGARTGMQHVASGDLFRRAMREKTEMGQLAQSYVDRGELVPDDVVIRMIIERINQPDCSGGVIFDGLPRA